jgi:hypothetical protein
MVTTPELELKRRLTTPSGFAPMVTIMDKWANLIPFRHNRLQRHFFQNYSLGTGMIDIVVKARQATITTSVLGETLRLTLTRATRSLTLMDKDKNTTAIREVLDRMYDSLPAEFDLGHRQIQKARRYTDNRTTSTYSNGSRWILGTAGSINVGRSQTTDILHGSEVAHWTDAKAIVKGAQQSARFAIWRLYESTANGAQGWFFDVAQQAKDPANRIYKLHFYPWWWTDEYRLPLLPGQRLVLDDKDKMLMAVHGLDLEQINWRQVMIAEMGFEFEQEYPEDIETCFLQSGLGYFGNVEGFFTASLSPVYDATHTYVAGLDFGQQRDWTVLYILDATTMQMVYMVRLRHESWKEMRTAVRLALAQWNVQLCLAESNAMGSSEIESLRNECDEAGMEITIWSFNMNAATKPPLMRTYRTAMHEGGLRHQDLPVVRAELRAARSKYTQKGWTVESPRDDSETGEFAGHGDTVVAGALAARAASGIVA